MTDVPFMCLTTLSIAAYLRFFSSSSESTWWVFWGSLFAALSCLVRQFGVFTGGAFVAVLVIDSLVRRDWPKWQVVLIWFAPWVFFWGGLQILPASGEGLGMTWDWNTLGWNLRLRIWNGFKHFIDALHYQTYFLIPILPLACYAGVRTLKNMKPIAVGMNLLGYLLVLWASGMLSKQLMPYTHNLLYDFGVGPLLFSGMVVDGHIDAPIQLNDFWWVVTVLTSVGAFIGLRYFVTLFVSLGKQLRKKKDLEVNLQEYFLAILSLLFIMGLFNPGLDVIYDRYFVAASAPLIILAVLKTKFLPIQYTAIATILWFSVSAYQLQDYMEWNRARWIAVDVLHDDMEIAPERVNGGYEYNGWFTSDAFFEGKVSSDKRVYGRKGWWVVEDDYAISMVPLPNYVVEKSIPYQSWLGLNRGEILIQKRVAEDEDPFIR
jgi:hypothetical protein